MSIERFNRHMDRLNDPIPVWADKKIRVLKNELAKQDRLIKGIRKIAEQSGEYGFLELIADGNRRFEKIANLLRLYDNSD